MEAKTLLDLVHRTVPAGAWTEGDNIPWHEPAFSERMLREHLSQAHDLASRRAATIDKHIRWIQASLLAHQPACVLDLGCGPGLYTQRLARLGNTCVGIDFSPASLRYAREQAAAEDVACTYHESDLRTFDFGGPFDLVMMIYGQFDVFRRDEACAILARARAALAEGGTLLLEVHMPDFLRKQGEREPSWSTHEQGLFSERPHLVLQESFWDEEASTCTERFFIVDAATGAVTRHALSTVAHTRDELCTMLTNAGMRDVTFSVSLTGNPEEAEEYSFVVLSKK